MSEYGCIWQGEWEERTRREYERTGTGLVAQWKRICLLVQGVAQFLVGEDSTCHGAAKPVGAAPEVALYSSHAVGP